MSANHGFFARRWRIESLNEPIALIHADSPVARSEGLAARARVEIAVDGKTTTARLYQVSGDLLGLHDVGLSEPTWSLLSLKEGEPVQLRHPCPLESMGAVRAKLYGHRLNQAQLLGIMRDIAHHRYSDVEISAFLAAFASEPPDVDEMVGLTKAMVDVGDHLAWDQRPVVDKHCVGGLPGNRTTPIIVAIAAAAGLTMPKTSSKAITSAAGTADTMAVMTTVDLDSAAIRKVVDREGGCLVWGGGVRLSPADDVLIRVERALELDAPAQLIASVLSKKVAAGSTCVVLDIPVGPTAKVRSQPEAAALCLSLKAVAQRFGLAVVTCLTDGHQPIGRGIGPALEAHDVLAVLRRQSGGPGDLRARALQLAGSVLEIGGAAGPGQGAAMAQEILDDGRAERKFVAICEAQGGFREPGRAPRQIALRSASGGVVRAFDNRRLSRLAKLAGAPRAQTAGLELHVRIGDRISANDPVMTLHGESEGELDYALGFAALNPDIVEIRP